jgi:hypothetical protein
MWPGTIFHEVCCACECNARKKITNKRFSFFIKYDLKIIKTKFQIDINMAIKNQGAIYNSFSINQPQVKNTDD